MSTQEILTVGGGALAVLLTFVQIAPIKINPWSWLAKSLGRALNADVLEKVDKLEKGLSGVQQSIAEEKAVTCRVRILRFGDECRQGTHHSKDYFDQILTDITVYKQYCEKHPDFQNSITIITCEYIEKLYERELAKGKDGFK